MDDFPPNAVLALNAGSSSLKFALFGGDTVTPLSLLAKGEIEEIGTAPHFTAQDGNGVALDETSWTGAAPAHGSDLLDRMLHWTDGHLGNTKLIAVGHRVVHGGRAFTAPVLVTDAVLTALDALTPLAPLHQPHSLKPIREIRRLRPDLRQVACFDTAFHHTMPAVATRFALPRTYHDDGVRRYGFHGLSYDYIARRLSVVAPELADRRVIAAHLGNGASLCAMKDGSSVETTMGFTALDGLVMGTRCGTLDAGVVLYMVQEKRLSPSDVQHLLYEKSGLLGVSGLSSDMRTLLASQDAKAKEAIELFVYRIVREICALTAALGGLDAIVFTGGIGEHSPEIRASVCRGLRWLGVVLGSPEPMPGSTSISTPESPIAVHVIPTDEELMIAQHTLETLLDILG